MTNLKVHTIIPGKLYQRGEFIQFPMHVKLRELKRLGVSIVVNLCPTPDILLKDEIPHYYHLPIPDSLVKNADVLLSTVNEVAQLIRQGQGAIVHCHAGRNRSGLFNALVCMELLGMSGEDAVEHIRKHRPNALANENFVKFLAEQKGGRKTVKVIAIGGVPGTGKTYLIKELMKQSLGWDHCSPTNLLMSEYNERLDLYVLGKYEGDETFAGTDRLSMAVQPQAQEWIKTCESDVIFEGDRLFNKSFLEFLTKVPSLELFIIYLKSSESTLSQRYKERGSDQSQTFLKGRETKYNNIQREIQFKKISREFTHETPDDTKKILSAIQLFLESGEINVPVQTAPATGIRKFFKI